MTYAFVSYKREDEVRVARIARALEAEGIALWWDRGLPGGESWHRNIEEKLDGASCVMVVWSKLSVAPQGHYVRDEARRGLADGRLVPVMIDRVRIPLGFGEVQAIDLTSWRGNRRDPFFQDLVAAVRAKLAGQPTPPSIGPKRRLFQRLAVGGASTAGVAACVALAFNTFGATTKICTAPGLQPGLSDVCGACGLAARPTRAERLAWARLPPGDCTALADHINRFPHGAFRAEAQALLVAKRVSTRVDWTPAHRLLALYGPDNDPPAASEPAAKAAVLQTAQADANRKCRDFATTGLARFQSASLRPDSWSCRQNAAGVVCHFDGAIDCALEERTETEVQTCGLIR